MYTELNNAQAKAIIDAEQAFEAWRDASRQMRGLRGGMHWKTISGKEYLYRVVTNKTSKSLGVRSAETEKLLADFTERKERLETLVKSLAEQLKTLARVNAAYRVGHVPNKVADICIALDDAGLLDTNITVIGTNAMHVYEAMAGVRLPGDLMATVDVDLLWNHTRKLSVGTSEALSAGGLLGVLRKADRSYQVLEAQPCRAVSARNYMVDLIRQMPNPTWADEPDRFFESDRAATDIWNMRWLLGAPRVIHTALALDGRPFRMAAPDPRAYAMFKLWLGTLAQDREPLKRQRDVAQADAVITLINERLPHLAQAWPQMHLFPKDTVEKAVERAQHMRG